MYFLSVASTSTALSFHHFALLSLFSTLLYKYVNNDGLITISESSSLFRQYSHSLKNKFMIYDASSSTFVTKKTRHRHHNFHSKYSRFSIFFCYFISTSFTSHNLMKSHRQSILFYRSSKANTQSLTLDGDNMIDQVPIKVVM